MDFDQDNPYKGPASPRELPTDLPRSLNDRRPISYHAQEVEEYDPWAGQSQFLTAPTPAQPLKFNLTLDDHSFDDERPLPSPGLHDSDTRLVQMLASQARLKEMALEGGEGAILANKDLSEQEKQDALQSIFTMAASNGEVDHVRKLLQGTTKALIDINKSDAEGTPPLIYASCFGHEEIVTILLDAGANADVQDKNQWSPLMWAMTNRHKGIAKVLLDHGANPDVKSSTGRTAFDFLAPNSEMSEYLHESGYDLGTAGVTEDFYDQGLSQDRFEEEMAENEMRRRMMMESAINLEVDLGNLGLDEQPESPEELEEEGQEFVWDRCLNDQMFVFQESELNRILDVLITKMTPSRSPSQKPVPANILFLAARYAHYHANRELLERLLLTAMDLINDVVERHQWDMTILAFWVSNATLLLHYLKKDTGLLGATIEFQSQLSELINEIFILIIRDAERRMDKVLDTAMLDHETIPGFEDVQFQNEWKLFRSKPKIRAPEPMEKRFRPPSPKRRAQVSPRNITSLLSSTLFVLDLYDIHSVIIAQVISQLYYWLNAELFNRVISNRKFLARTKAMQIRMNVTMLEEWAGQNNRQPEHYENGSMVSTGENTMEIARRHMAPFVQLLQWLQCFSSLGEDLDALKETISQLPRVTPQQLLHSVKYYRAEVGEKTLSKAALKYIETTQKELVERRKEQKRRAESPAPSPQPPQGEMRPSTPTRNGQNLAPGSAIPSSPMTPDRHSDEQDAPDNLLLDPALMLPFSLPTSTDMLISYGAGFGGTNRERARKYIPTVPPEFLAKLDVGGGQQGMNGSGYESRWASR